MENAVDALYMAGAVLILIIALSVSISSLMTLKSRTYDIVTMDEQIDETSYIEDGKLKYVNYITSDDMDVRIVGADAVTSALYRLVTEDYKIYIKLKDTTGLEDIGIETSKAYRNQTYTTKNGGTDIIISQGDDLIEFVLAKRGKGQDIQNTEYVKNILTNEFYDKIKEKTFKEYLGEYQNNSDIAQDNKETKRIITFIEQ